MAEQRINGIQPPTPEQVARAQSVMDALNPAFGTVINTMVQGLAHVAGPVDVPTILSLIAFHTGHVLASSVNAPDLRAMSILRQSLLKSFEEGVKKAPLLKTGPMPVPPAAHGHG